MTIYTIGKIAAVTIMWLGGFIAIAGIYIFTSIKEDIMGLFIILIGMFFVAMGIVIIWETKPSSTPAPEISSCESTDSSTETEFAEDPAAVKLLSDALSCDRITAQSLCDIIEEAGIHGIESITENHSRPGDTVLAITTDDNHMYYVFVGRGYFISSIRESSVDGKALYRAIQ